MGLYVKVYWHGDPRWPPIPSHPDLEAQEKVLLMLKTLACPWPLQVGIAGVYARKAYSIAGTCSSAGKSMGGRDVLGSVLAASVSASFPG